MAVKPVVTYGHKSLRTVAQEIVDFKDINILINDLFDTMYENDGIGLAANQIGVNFKIFVVDISHTEEAESPMVFINGKIMDCSGETIDTEGCLSLPDIRIRVKRCSEILFSYLDENLVHHEKTFSGLLSTVIQHENDHLEAKLITDYASPSDLIKYEKKLNELLESNAKRRS